MSSAAGWFALLLIVLGFCMTFHRYLTGRIVGLVLVLGPAVLLLADDWLHR